MFGFGDNRTENLRKMWTDARVANNNAVSAIGAFMNDARDKEYSREEVNGFLKKHLTLR